VPSVIGRLHRNQGELTLHFVSWAGASPRRGQRHTNQASLRYLYRSASVRHRSSAKSLCTLSCVVTSIPCSPEVVLAIVGFSFTFKLAVPVLDEAYEPPQPNWLIVGVPIFEIVGGLVGGILLGGIVRHRFQSPSTSRAPRPAPANCCGHSEAPCLAPLALSFQIGVSTCRQLSRIHQLSSRSARCSWRP
jgi:hypothetical protein